MFTENASSAMCTRRALCIGSASSTRARPTLHRSGVRSRKRFISTNIASLNVSFAAKECPDHSFFLIGRSYAARISIMWVAEVQVAQFLRQGRDLDRIEGMRLDSF